MILTTLLLMQGQVLAPAETGEEGRGILPNLFSADTDIHLFGRFQQDFAYIDDDNFGTKDGSEVRRARLGAGGNLAEGLDGPGNSPGISRSMRLLPSTATTAVTYSLQDGLRWPAADLTEQAVDFARDDILLQAHAVFVRVFLELLDFVQSAVGVWILCPYPAFEAECPVIP